MSDKSPIEWLNGGATWNPIRARNLKTGAVGWHCEHVTEACTNCYAEAFNHQRLGTRLPYKPGHRKDIHIYLDERTLTQPLRWKRPREIFPCSMTDLFADFVPDEFLDKMFAVMAATPRHTYKILTKRPARAREYLNRDIQDALDDVVHTLVKGNETWHYPATWPLPNVWLGASIHNQASADEFLPILLDTRAAVHWASAEPLLAGVLISKYLGWKCAVGGHVKGENVCGDCDPCIGALGRNFLRQVVVGGESGPPAQVRSTDIQWIRSIVAQCRAAGVACYVKQVGTRPTLHGFTNMPLRDRKGGDMRDWPQDIQVREDIR
jgi:protein gp37